LVEVGALALADRVQRLDLGLRCWPWGIALLGIAVLLTVTVRLPSVLVTSVGSAVSVEFISQRGPYQPEELADAFLELGRILGQAGFDLDLDVDTGATGTVIRLTDLLGQADVEFQRHAFIS